MVKLSVCIEPFFSDKPYEERLRKIAALGFTAYEFWFHDKRFDGSGLVPEMKDFSRLAALNKELGLTTTDFAFNHPDGGIVASLIQRKDRSKLLDNIESMIEKAKIIGCTTFISGSGNKVAGLSREEAVDSMVEGLSALAPILTRSGMKIILEPFNTRVDHPDYFLDSPWVGVEVLKKVGSPAVKLLYDIYHMQIMDGNVLSFVKANLPYIGHFHVAGVPGRKEPVPSELDYPFILKEIDRMGYTGYFGLEYWPSGDPAESLAGTRRALLGKDG